MVLTKDMQVYFSYVNYYEAKKKKKSVWDPALMQDSLYYKKDTQASLGILWHFSKPNYLQQTSLRKYQDQGHWTVP